MNILDIITRKKNGNPLSYDELKYAFMGYLNKDIPDYQMSALLMAITINGMNLSETLALTDIFIKSGESYDLSDIDYVVDKHSTGGVGDTTTLVIGPMCAALGLHMAKMSGRGLGFTGGTIDKLESIPGFNVNLNDDEFINQVKNLGFAISSQTKDLVPLDKAIYALRDVTGTTESLPLIASSIMSKKIAAGSPNILIDIKVGTGALIKNVKDAEKLSDWLIEIGSSYNRNVRTIISDMNTPLSNAIGNALEVVEASNVLHGNKSKLYDSCIEIVANLLNMAKGVDIIEAEILAKRCIEDGSALKKFYEFIDAQGGRIKELKISDNRIQIKAHEDGTVVSIDALGAAKLACELGASKMTLDEEIDYTVGLYFSVGVGSTVHVGDVLFTMFLKNDDDKDYLSREYDFINIVS